MDKQNTSQRSTQTRETLFKEKEQQFGTKSLIKKDMVS